MNAIPANDYEVKAGLAQVDPFDVVGVSVITSNKDGKAADDINKLWEDFFQTSVGQRVLNKENDVIYAVYSDYEGDHEAPYRITIGYKVTEKPTDMDDDLVHVAVQKGEYGIMSAAGEQPKALLETWEAIWSSDLDRTFQTDFEVYGPRFFEAGVHEVLVHIGLKGEV